MQSVRARRLSCNGQCLFPLCLRGIIAQDRRYALLLGGFIEESAALRLSAHSAPDAELSASVDIGGTRLTGTVSHS